MPDARHVVTTTTWSDPLRFREARRWAFQVALDAGFDTSDAHALAVALAEACANVHRHAYRGRRDGRIELTIDADPSRVTLTLRHDGEPFDPARYLPPDLTRPAERGYGLFLISRLVDDVSFETGERGPGIVLVKWRRNALAAASRGKGSR